MISALLALTLWALPLAAAPAVSEVPPVPTGRISIRTAPAQSEGQRLYDLGDYQGAETWYRQALRTDPRNAELCYDLGNALFKSGKTGPAIAAYQRAFDMRPRDADIRQNLDFALHRAGEELVPGGVPPLLFTVYHIFSERELAGLQWLAWWLLCALGGICLWRESLRPRLLSWAVAAAVLWLAVGSWWLAVRGITPQKRGVIVAAGAEIRSGPGENFNVSFTAPEGRRVQILSSDGHWMEIGVLKEGAKGWIPASAVEEIEP